MNLADNKFANYIVKNLYWILPLGTTIYTIVSNSMSTKKQNRLLEDRIALNLVEYRLGVINEVKRIFIQIGEENTFSVQMYRDFSKLLDEGIRIFFDEDIVLLASDILQKMNSGRMASEKIRLSGSNPNRYSNYDGLIDQENDTISEMLELFPKLIKKMSNTIKFGKYKTEGGFKKGTIDEEKTN